MSHMAVGEVLITRILSCALLQPRRTLLTVYFGQLSTYIAVVDVWLLKGILCCSTGQAVSPQHRGLSHFSET